MLTFCFKERIARNSGRLKQPMFVGSAHKLLIVLLKQASSRARPALTDPGERTGSQFGLNRRP